MNDSANRSLEVIRIKMAQNPILNLINTLKQLAKRGYVSLLDYYNQQRPEQSFMGMPYVYQKVSSLISEPPCARPACTVVYA